MITLIMQHLYGPAGYEKRMTGWFTGIFSGLTLESPSVVRLKTGIVPVMTRPRPCIKQNTNKRCHINVCFYDCELKEVHSTLHTWIQCCRIKTAVQLVVKLYGQWQSKLAVEIKCVHSGKKTKNEQYHSEWPPLTMQSETVSQSQINE